MYFDFFFSEISRKARNVEVEVDLKITALSKLCAGHDSHSIDTEPLLPKDNLVESSAAEIEDLLSHLSSLNDKLDSATAPDRLTSIQHHTLQRHREILDDYNFDFNKIYDNYKKQKQQRELMSSVDHDLDLHKSGYNRRLEMYIKENDHLHSSSRLIDDQINIAVETREQLISQRLNMKRLQTRLHDIASRFPIVNSLVQRINLHKRRDSIIIGIIVFVCTFLLLSYAFH